MTQYRCRTGWRPWDVSVAVDRVWENVTEVRSSDTFLKVSIALNQCNTGMYDHGYHSRSPVL